MKKKNVTFAQKCIFSGRPIFSIMSNSARFPMICKGVLLVLLFYNPKPSYSQLSSKQQEEKKIWIVICWWGEANDIWWINEFRIPAPLRQRRAVSNIMLYFCSWNRCQLKKLVFTFSKLYLFLSLPPAFPCPHILKKDSQVPQFKWTENAIHGGRVPVEGIVVRVDLFGSNDSIQPLSPTLLNKPMTDWVLPQKYQELKHSQQEQAAGPVNSLKWGELVNKKGWEAGSKGVNLQWARGSKKVHSIAQVRSDKRGAFPELSPSTQ